MTSKHTPGPWCICLNDTQIMTTRGEGICSLHPSFFSYRANAGLIAAAPKTAAERDSLRAEVERLNKWADSIQKARLIGEAYQRELRDEITSLEDINAELLAALDHISQMQRDKCENADANTLYMLLDNKVCVALAAIAKAKEQSS